MCWAIISLLLLGYDPSAVSLVSEVLLLRWLEIVVDSFRLLKCNIAGLQFVYHLESLGFILSSSLLVLDWFEFFVSFRGFWTLHCTKDKVALFQIRGLSWISANFGLCINSSRIKRLCTLHTFKVFIWISESKLSLLHSLLELLSVFVHVIG